MIPKTGAIPTDPHRFPDSIEYDATACRLRFGDGCVDNVPRAVWASEGANAGLASRLHSPRPLRADLLGYLCADGG